MGLSIVERLGLQAGVGNQDIMLVGIAVCGKSRRWGLRAWNVMLIRRSGGET